MPHDRNTQPAHFISPHAANSSKYAGDLQLIERLRIGQADAWQELVDGYGAMIHARVVDAANAFHLEWDQKLIEDTTAYVFVSLLADRRAAFKAYTGRSSLRAFLAIAATRVSKRVFVRKKLALQQRRRAAREASASQLGLHKETLHDADVEY